MLARQGKRPGGAEKPHRKPKEKVPKARPQSARGTAPTRCCGCGGLGGSLHLQIGCAGSPRTRP